MLVLYKDLLHVDNITRCNYITVGDAPIEARVIIHINPLMFHVIDDKPEGVGQGFIHYHINNERVYVLLTRGQFCMRGL